MGDSVVIDGEVFRRRKHRTKHYECNGRWYETPEERDLALLLESMDIKFVHHIALPLSMRNRDQTEKHWVPDFVFPDFWRWVDPDLCNGSVILGIEVKRKVAYDADAIAYSRRLQRTRGIPILVLSGHRIAQYCTTGHLPMKKV